MTRVANIAAERATRLAIARVLDEATVALLALTSSPAACIQAAYEDRNGIPAYDDVPGIEPRNELKRCRYCDLRFWARRWDMVFCSASCRGRATYRRRLGVA